MNNNEYLSSGSRLARLLRLHSHASLLPAHHGHSPHLSLYVHQGIHQVHFTSSVSSQLLVLFHFGFSLGCSGVRKSGNL